MSACQDCALGAAAARLALETCRWQIVNVITTLTQEQQVSPINLLRADGEGGREKGAGVQRGKAAESLSGGCRPGAGSHVPLLPSAGWLDRIHPDLTWRRVGLRQVLREGSRTGVSGLASPAHLHLCECGNISSNRRERERGSGPHRGVWGGRAPSPAPLGWVDPSPPHAAVKTQECSPRGVSQVLAGDEHTSCLLQRAAGALAAQRHC